SDVLFSGGDISKLKTTQVAQLENVIPTSTSKTKDLLEELVNIGAVSSKRQAREFIESNSISINGKTISDVDHKIKPIEFDKKYSIIKKGKKKFFLIKH
ncbi:MAG: hypothetical protein KAG04_00210, partial [Mycoplasmataceae bacterium]|nr:hypothetical protein [Mycoplasmataceae bacterium]